MADKTFSIDIKTGLSNPGAFQQASQGLNEVQGATRQLAGETEKLTQELADLEAGERSLKTTFGGAVAARMTALREELALRKEISAEIKATPAAPGGAGGGAMIGNDGEDVSDSGGGGRSGMDPARKQLMQGAQGARFAHRALMGGGEAEAMLALSEGLTALGASFTVVLGSMAALVGGIAIYREGIKDLMEDTPHLKKETEQLGKALHEFLKPAFEAVVESGDKMLASTRLLTAAMGGETEAMALVHKGIEGYIPLAEAAKTATGKWAETFKDIRNNAEAAIASIRNVAAEEDAADKSESAENKRALADEIAEINDNEALSAEEKAVRIIDAEKRTADTEAFFVSQKRARAFQAAADEDEVEHKKLELIVKSVHEQEARAKALNDLGIAYEDKRKATAAKEEMEGANAAKGIVGAGLDFVKSPGLAIGHAMGFGGDKEAAQKRQEEAAQVEADITAANDKIKAAREAVKANGGVVPDSGKDAEKNAKEEEDALKKRKDEARAQAKRVVDSEDKTQHLSNLDDIAKTRERAEAAARQEEHDRKRDKLTGTGNDENIAKGGLDEQNQAKWEQKEREKKDQQPHITGVRNVGGGSAGGSGVGTGGGGMSGGDYHGVLGQIEVNTRGGGGGAQGSSGHGSGAGGGVFAAPAQGHLDHAQHPSHESQKDVKAQLEKYAADRLAFDMGQATSNPDYFQGQKDLSKAGADFAGRMQGLDAATAEHMANGGTPEGAAHGLDAHTKSAVFDPAKHGGHGQAPQEVGRAMGEAAAEPIAVKVHAAITEGDKAKMAKIAQEDHDAAVAGHPRVVGMQSDDPNDNTGKGKFAAGGRGGVGGYGMGSPHGDKPAPEPGDPDPFAHQQQGHGQVPAGTQVVGLPDTSPFAQMGAMMATMNMAATHLRRIADGLPTHVKEMRGRTVDPFAR